MADSFDPQTKAEFDQYAQSYDQLHRQNVAISGESPEYFAIYKQRFLERLVGDPRAPLLDFGCGIGNLTRLLVGPFAEVAGYDPSADSVVLAKTRAAGASFYDDVDAIPKAHFGAVVIANVLHHVPPNARAALLATVTRLLAPGGKLVVFEHNPHNPVTRKVVRDCAFDENAVLLAPSETRRLLEGAGLRHTRVDYIVFFPRPLAALRGLEPHLSWLPLGAQYAAWATKP